MPESTHPGLVSHETIYTAICAQSRGGLKQAMAEALRQAKPTRGLGIKAAAAKTFVLEELSIRYRPEGIEQRLLPGHWEWRLDQGGLKPLGRWHAGGAQDTLCHPVLDGWLHRDSRAGGLQSPDKEIARVPARKPDASEILCAGDTMKPGRLYATQEEVPGRCVGV